MTIQLDPTITPDHHSLVQDALRSTGIPGKVEITDHELNIVTPVYASSDAIEILRPVVESILERIVVELKHKRR